MSLLRALHRVSSLHNVLGHHAASRPASSGTTTSSLAASTATANTTALSDKSSATEDAAPLPPHRTLQHFASDSELGEKPAPSPFRNRAFEIGFIVSMSLTQVVAEFLISGFGVILPYLVEEFPDPSVSQLWPTSVMTLVVASLTLPCSRAVDMYGGYPFFLAGVLWLALWALLGGFARSEVFLVVARAMQGLAITAIQCGAFQLIGTTYPPGRKRNIVLGLYGACAPVGFFAGIGTSGLAVQFASWNVYFYTAAGAALFVAVLAYVTVPTTAIASSRATNKDKGLSMDWLGTVTITPGLFLLAYALAASSHVSRGWRAPEVLTTLFLGLLLLATGLWIEIRIAACPLLPARFFRTRSTLPFCIAGLFFYATFGTFLFYSTFYMRDIMHGEGLQTVLWYLPLAVGGFVVAAVGGSVLHAFPNTYLLWFSGAAWTLAPLLLAFAPADLLSTRVVYWGFVFPAMICATLGLDLTYTISTVFFSTSQPARYQALAGAVASVLVNLGISFSLAFADIVESVERRRGKGLLEGYRAVFYYAGASAYVGFVVCLVWVRIPKADKDLSGDEGAGEEESAFGGGGVGEGDGEGTGRLGIERVGIEGAVSTGVEEGRERERR